MGKEGASNLVSLLSKSLEPVTDMHKYDRVICSCGISMNNWLIVFHFEMIGIEFVFKLSQKCGIWSTLNIWENIHMDHHYIA